MSAGSHRLVAGLIVLLLVLAAGCTTSKMFLFGDESNDDRLGKLLAESDSAPVRQLVKSRTPAASPPSEGPAASKPAADSAGPKPVASPSKPAEGPPAVAPAVAPTTAPVANASASASPASPSLPPTKDSEPEPSESTADETKLAADPPKPVIDPLGEAARFSVPAPEVHTTIAPSQARTAQDMRPALDEWLSELAATAQNPALTEAERRTAELRRQVARLLLDEASPRPAVDPFGDSQLLAPHDRATAAQVRSLQLLLADTRVASEQWTATAESLRSVTEAFVPLCPLELRNLEFCRAVHGYGVIEPFTTRAFRPRQEVLLYVELENFDAQVVATGYETELRAGYRLIDAEGRKVAEQVLPLDKQISRNRRRDYFIAYRVFMPAELKPGRYRLQLTIDDVKGHKSAAAPIDFSLVPR